MPLPEVSFSDFLSYLLVPDIPQGLGDNEHFIQKVYTTYADHSGISIEEIFQKTPSASGKKEDGYLNALCPFFNNLMDAADQVAQELGHTARTRIRCQRFPNHTPSTDVYNSSKPDMALVLSEQDDPVIYDWQSFIAFGEEKRQGNDNAVYDASTIVLIARSIF